MASIRGAYSLFPRPRAKGKPVFYFHAYDAEGRRLTARSTGKTSKSEARAYCDELLRSGRLANPEAPTLSAWIEARQWYDWPRKQAEPNCLYCKGRLARSSKDRPAIGRGHVDRCAAYLRDYIAPTFGDVHLDRIMPDDLERWMFDLAAKGLATKTVNNIASAFRVMTGEALRLELIADDPWKRVPLFSAEGKPRGVLTVAEAMQLMDPETVDTVWKGNQLNYLISLTAMLTACRQGELLALRRENLHEDHLDIEASWTIRYHERGPTKTKTKAPVPIPPYLFKLLDGFAEWEGYLFSYTAGKTPATGARVADALYDALGKIGIDDTTRRERGLVFHSWRRFANTYLRSRGLPDAKVRQLTRHKAESMTEHYTSWNAGDFADVVEEQELLSKALVDLKARARVIKENPTR
jgi:integrase